MNASITLCMIVKNEEKDLERCLESVKGQVDEIIIVDTGSSDDTINIAKKFTSEVHSFTWNQHFAEARNYSIRKATKDYILVLDADEYLDKNVDLQQDISSGLDYYLFNIKNYYSSSESFMHRAVRLFVNNENLFYENRLHEHLNIVGNPTFQGGEADSLIHHTGYSQKTMDDKDKLKRNLSLMQKAVRENPDAYNLYNMGKTYLSLNEHLKAADYFKKAYPLSTNRVFLPELLTKLAFSLGELARYEEGLQILIDAVPLFPEETEMLFIQGTLLHKAGYQKDAIAAFQQCLKLGDSGTLVTEGSGSYRAMEFIGEIYESQRKLSLAFEAVLQSLQIKKNYIPALRRYFNITLKARIPLNEVYETIRQLYDIKNIGDLQLLVDVMYDLRHPLLSRLLMDYRITVPVNIEAVASLFDKRYEDARTGMMTVERITSLDNGPDMLLLAYLLKDSLLLKQAVQVLNLSQRESKLLSKLVCREEINPAQLTNAGEALLLEIAKQLIILQEPEQFEAITKELLGTKLETQCKLAVLLVDYGYENVAFDLLVKLYGEKPLSIPVIELLGDLCCKMGYTDDAEVLYARLMELKPVYSSYEKCYDLFESRNNITGMRRIWQKIQQQFPLSQWQISLKK
ncbi:glycosyltransferase [Paenibacillus camerounensis]|uniref:glycosyltransferase n=1 Tax=Paenibacillus camerounensis TaxID=1243663 RepID=UPI0005AA1095|nr:glycosyltransferase [Paenibacillus camerounensis]